MRKVINLRRKGDFLFTFRDDNSRHCVNSLVMAESPDVYAARIITTRSPGNFQIEFDQASVFAIRSLDLEHRVVRLTFSARREADYQPAQTQPWTYIDSPGVIFNANYRRQIRGLASEIVAGEKDELEIARKIYGFITQHGSYGRPLLEYEKIPKEDYVQHEYWCIYYADALAILLQAAGIRAGMTTGTFARTTMKIDRARYGFVHTNEDGKDFLSKTMAEQTHVWTEAWLGGKNFPFDVTWDLGSKEWNYFAGFTASADNKEFHPYKLRYNVEELQRVLV